MTSKDKELTFEDIIAQAIGAPKGLIHKAIDKMNAYFVAYNKTEKRPYKIEYAVGCSVVNKNNTFKYNK